jgi:hypothetical protein
MGKNGEYSEEGQGSQMAAVPMMMMKTNSVVFNPHA